MRFLLVLTILTLLFIGSSPSPTLAVAAKWGSCIAPISGEKKEAREVTIKIGVYNKGEGIVEGLRDFTDKGICLSDFLAEPGQGSPQIIKLVFASSSKPPLPFPERFLVEFKLNCTLVGWSCLEKAIGENPVFEVSSKTAEYRRDGESVDYLIRDAKVIDGLAKNRGKLVSYANNWQLNFFEAKEKTGKEFGKRFARVTRGKIECDVR